MLIEAFPWQLISCCHDIVRDTFHGILSNFVNEFIVFVFHNYKNVNIVLVKSHSNNFSIILNQFKPFVITQKSKKAIMKSKMAYF